MLASTSSIVLSVLSAAHPAGGHAVESVGAIPTVSQGIGTAITAIVVFAIVFAFLGVKVWPVIGKALDERANKIKEEIEAAELARRQAKDALDQYQKSLADARVEAQRMIEQAKSQQLTVAAELKARADIELTQMREKALKDIESAKRTAISELYNQTAALSTTLAGKILKRNITPADHQQLIEESLGQLQGMKN
jgi:F-type H+-transporting ATPase subunit b